MRLVRPSTEFIILSSNTFCWILYQKPIDQVATSVRRLASLLLVLFSLPMIYSISNGNLSKTVANICRAAGCRRRFAPPLPAAHIHAQAALSHQYRLLCSLSYLFLYRHVGISYITAMHISAWGKDNEKGRPDARTPFRHWDFSWSIWTSIRVAFWILHRLNNAYSRESTGLAESFVVFLWMSLVVRVVVLLTLSSTKATTKLEESGQRRPTKGANDWLGDDFDISCTQKCLIKFHKKVSNRYHQR